MPNLAKFAKPGETIILECIIDTNLTMIWSYLKNIKTEETTLTEDTYVNPKYITKFNLIGKRYRGEYFLKIINVTSKDEGKYSCYQQGQTISIVQVDLHLEGIYHCILHISDPRIRIELNPSHIFYV